MSCLARGAVQEALVACHIDFEEDLTTFNNYQNHVFLWVTYLFCFCCCACLCVCVCVCVFFEGGVTYDSCRALEEELRTSKNDGTLVINGTSRDQHFLLF